MNKMAKHGAKPETMLLTRLRAASLDTAPLSLGHRRTASPHEFYRYPARFAPSFARAAMEAFTAPGDLILDPFVGGGTSLVEARLLGRRAVGADINALATFVTRAKARCYSPSAVEEVRKWGASSTANASVSAAEPDLGRWEDDGYLVHLSTPQTWRLRKLIAQILVTVDELPPSTEMLARCALLRTAQWALDMRAEIPTPSEFRGALRQNVQGMANAADDFRRSAMRADRASRGDGSRRTVVVQEGLPGLTNRLREMRVPTPKLVLTSPPYPGVYVNYHRWKMQGRREIKAPFWIARQLDGQGLSYYTMSARVERPPPGSRPTLEKYFEKLQAAYADLVGAVDRNTVVVQIVGFNRPTQHLPRFLDAMRAAGFEEVLYDELATRKDGRLWRSVPGRRWWAEAGRLKAAVPHTSSEVVLIHRKLRSKSNKILN